MNFSRRPGREWVCLCVMLAVLGVSGVALGAPSGEEAARRQEARQHLATGKKLLRDNFATDAATELERSVDLYPTPEALEELAAAYRVLGRTVSARSSYDSILSTYGGTLKDRDRTRVASLRDAVDRDVVRLSVDTEPGATITVDGNQTGTAPLAAPLELDPGRHGIAVTKDGFLEDRRVAELPPGPSRLAIPLKAALTVGKVSIRTTPPETARVTIDGREYGETPLTVELAPGKHHVSVSSKTSSSTPRDVEVRLGDTQSLLFSLKAFGASLRIEVPDPSYAVSVDGAPKGTGDFQGDLPAGTHRVRIEKAGFSPYEREVTLRGGESSAVVAPYLTVVSGSPTPPPAELPNESPDQKPEEKDDYPGVYAGISLMGTFGTKGTNGLWNGCPGDSCDRVTALGGGLGIKLGYSFGWIGIEGTVLGLGDASGTKVDFKTATTQAESPYFGAPRNDTFSFIRYGAGGALGLRLAAPIPGVRPTLGVSGALLARWARYVSAATVQPNVAQGIVPDAKDHNSDAQSFVAPALMVDAGILVGSTPGLKVHLAILLLAEFDPTTTAEAFTNTVGSRVTVGGTERIAHGAPAIGLTNGTQIFLGPVLGMQFGH